ncbi:MAG: hypothetical protein ACRDRD_13765 [Pseudonocardiaceae bacterium]
MFLPIIADTVLSGGVGYNGATVNAWKASRFSGVPAENASPPVGTADAGPVTSGTVFGGEGAFQITVPTYEPYYLQITIGAATGWRLTVPVTGGGGGGVTSVAGHTGIVTLAEGDITSLVSDLAAKAPLASPALTGSPTTPDPTATQGIASKHYVDTHAGGVTETADVISASTASQALDLTLGTVFDVTLAVATTTFSFTNPVGGGAVNSFTLWLRQDGTGGRAVVWPASVKWPSGLAPTISTGINKLDVYSFSSRDGGTTWLGFTAAQDLR